MFLRRKEEDIDEASARDIEFSNMSRSDTDNVEPTAPLIGREDEDNDPHVESDAVSKEYGKVFIWSLAASAGVSGLLFGYDTGVISSMLVSIGTDLSGRVLTTLDMSIITSCASLFALIASPCAGSIADRLGRKRVMFFADILFIAGALWQALTSKVWGMILGRSIVGLAIGAASFVVPLYISEVAPSEVRGRLVTVNNLFITGGQVVAYIVGWMFSNHSSGWRWMVGLGAVPAAIQLFALIFMSESPRWLVKVGRSEHARSVLSRVYGSSDGSNEHVVVSIIRSIEQEHLSEGATTSPPKDDASISCFGRMDDLESLFSVGAHRRALTIACLLQGLQQLCGFNSLMYFAAVIFRAIGFSSPTLIALSIAFTNFLFTLPAFYLIDRTGRRLILLTTIPIMILSLLLCATGFVFLSKNPQPDSTAHSGPMNKTPALTILISMLFYVASYASGIGVVPWQQSELFPLNVRSVGSAIATSTNWSANFVVGLTFLPMMELLTPGWTFTFYAAVCAMGWVAIWGIYPETAGLGLEEVAELLRNGWGVRRAK